MKKKVAIALSVCLALGVVYALNVNKDDNINLVAQNTNEKENDIQEIVASEENINVQELDEEMINYVKETKDIGKVFNNIENLSTSAIDTIAKDYITQTKDYGMYYSFKPYLSQEMNKELSIIVEDNLGPIAEPKEATNKELDQEMINYVKETKDIGKVFNNIENLSTDTIDKIAKDYITQTKDYGMYYSFKPYLSQEMSKELSIIVEDNLGHIAEPKESTNKEIDEEMINYVKETKDIGKVFNEVENLSTDAIDKIAKNYITETKDYGMYYSLKPYLSSEMNEELKELVGAM